MRSAVFLLMTASVFSQAPATRRLEFEVASVKLNPTSSTAGGRFDPEMARWTFSLQDYQIIGGPSWLASDR